MCSHQPQVIHHVVGDTTERIERERGAALLGRQETAREPERARMRADNAAAVRFVGERHFRGLSEQVMGPLSHSTVTKHNQDDGMPIGSAMHTIRD